MANIRRYFSRLRRKHQHISLVKKKAKNTSEAIKIRKETRISKIFDKYLETDHKRFPIKWKRFSVLSSRWQFWLGKLFFLKKEKKLKSELSDPHFN